MTERKKAVDKEEERQLAVQNELALLDYWQSEVQYLEIEPTNFPHLRVDEVALARFATADIYANNIQIIRHMVVDPGVQNKLDILATNIYKASEAKLDKDLGDIEGEPDLELIRKRAALVISADFNSSLDRAVKDGDEKRISRSNFPGLRAVDDHQILQYKLSAIRNAIIFLEQMIEISRSSYIGFNESEQTEIIQAKEIFEKKLEYAKKRYLELVKEFQQTAD